jgi:hypothetical protein
MSAHAMVCAPAGIAINQKIAINGRAPIITSSFPDTSYER